MAEIDLSGIWSLNCSKPGFQPIPARIPGENCSALIEAGLAGDGRGKVRGKETFIQFHDDYPFFFFRN